MLFRLFFFRCGGFQAKKSVNNLLIWKRSFNLHRVLSRNKMEMEGLGEISCSSSSSSNESSPSVTSVNVSGSVSGSVSVASTPGNTTGSSSYFSSMESPLPSTPYGDCLTTIAVCQMISTHDKASNLAHAKILVRNAKNAGAKIVFLPEGFDYIGRSLEETVELSETLDGPTITEYKRLAEEHRMWISLGGFHHRLTQLKPDGSPWLSNSHIMIDASGEIKAIYNKIHLFDVSISAENMKLMESSYVKPGDKVVCCNTPIGNVGLGVCYDLRFPEFGMALRKMGAEVLTYPSAFTEYTGEAHWQLLLRARAVENQCYVIAPAQVGQHTETRRSYGHAMVVNPWGTVVQELARPVGGVLIAHVNSEMIVQVREEMPVMSHKRLFQPDHPFVGSAGKSRPPMYTIPKPEEAKIPLQFGQFDTFNENVFLESKSSRAFVNRKCVVPGHVLIVSKRVVERLEGLTAEEVSDLFLLATTVQRIMESIYKVKSSTICVQDGKDAGQTVRHVHIHILPRKPADFADNDTIYEELATHDKGPDVEWRNKDVMIQECNFIRYHIKAHFSNLIQ